MNEVLTDFFNHFAKSLIHNPIFLLVGLCVIADTLFGCFRAIKEGRINSCFGIDGAIRKTVMLASLVFLTLFDTIVNINLVSFVPEQVLAAINLTKIGTAEFFGLLYVAYEIVSILKNLTLCGLPLKAVWEKVRTFLSKWTTELPDEN